MLIAALTALAGCGSSSSGDKKEPVATAKRSSFNGAEATPPKPAPPLRLVDSTGKPFDMASTRGKVVLVTFLYVHCPDVCPLIAGNLHTALTKLGPRAKDVKLVAVSTDPKGDKPKAVNDFLAKHQLKGEMRYLLGSKSQLRDVWKTWGIVAKPDPSAPGRVGHSSLTYGISASGKITTLYAANAGAAQYAHDVPLLAKQ